uniref:Uncharacterized protein n=1 Tax=Octopus bimaculoides TaxID=37653 RepID=A0A0L8HBB4_OCTBM
MIFFSCPLNRQPVQMDRQTKPAVFYRILLLKHLTNFIILIPKRQTLHKHV